MLVMSVQNEKGGCGKSTTSVNLAYGLSQEGKRVLLVDSDPQSNATSVVLRLSKELDVKGMEKTLSYYNDDEFIPLDEARKVLGWYVSKREFPIDISDVLDNPSNIEQAIVQSPYENLWVLPSSHKLSSSDMKLKNAVRNADGRLRNALDRVEDRFDVVIIDNSPFENALTYNSISACYRSGDTIIIPTKIDQGGLEGLDHTITTMIEWLEYGDLEYDFKILGTMVNKNKTDITAMKFLRKLFGTRVFDTTVRYQAKPVVSASMAKEILIYKSDSGVADDYRKLVKEVLDKL